MLEKLKSNWKRTVSGLLAMVMAIGLIPATSFAADTAVSSNSYAPTGNFELSVAGSTAWNGGDGPITVYKTENGSTRVTTIPVSTPFALLEDRGGDRVKIGYVPDGGWRGSTLEGIGWADKASVLINLPDVLPSIACESDSGRLFNSRLTRFEYVIPASYGLAEQLAQRQQSAMDSGKTLVVRRTGQTVNISLAMGDPVQLHSYSLDGAAYQKYDTWTEYETADEHLSNLSYDLPYDIDQAYSADPSVTLTMCCPQSTPLRVPAAANSTPTGGVGAYNPGSAGGNRPSTSNVAWATDPERTFLRFTLVEFPQGVVTNLNDDDWNTWHIVGTPLNVVWSKGSDGQTWSADKCRNDITWYNSHALRYNSKGADAAQLMAGSSVEHGVYSYDATSGHNKRWVTTADEFQAESGITDQQKEQMFHCNSQSWSSGWKDGDYTSMWGTDAESVTPGNLYKVYKANDAFLHLLNRLSENDDGAGGDIPGWSKEEAMKRWSEYVHDADGNLRTKYRIIVETGAIIRDPDGGRRAFTLRDMMAYSLYNNESNSKYTLIYDQMSTMVNMAQWMRQAKDNQFVEYPLNESGTPTGEELHSVNGFRECDSYVDTIQYARPIRDTIFNERRSFGLHIFSPFNFEGNEHTTPTLEVTKKAGSGIFDNEEWGFTVKYTSGNPTSFSAKKNDIDCTNQVTETGNGLKFKLKAGETIHIEFDAPPSFRCEVTEDDSSKLTNIIGTGGIANMTAKKFTTTSGNAQATFTNGDTPDEPDNPPPTPTPTPGKAILFKRDANTNKGVGPATFKFSSVVNGVYEFDTNASGELETIQWWDPTEAAGKYIKPGEYAVSEIVPPPNYEPTSEVQQIKLELDADGNPIPAGPLVFKNLAKVGLRLVKYDRQSHQPMNGVTFEIFRNGTSIGRYETKGQGEILLTGIEPGTYRAVEVDTGDEGHILDTSYQEVELVAGGGTKELIFFNDTKPGMKLVKVDSSDPSKTIPNAKFRIRAVDGSFGSQEYVTNGSGEIDLSNLPTGAYEVTEVECAGYVIDDAQRIIHLKANDTAQFVFTNTKKPGFRLVKTSADGAPLDGVTFRIAPIGDVSRSIDRTTQNGGEILVEGLEPGIYSVQETATLPNHILDTTEYHVELSPGKTSELRLSNDKKPGFRLIKTSADGTPLDGVTFRIARIEDGSRYLDRTTKNGGEIFVEDLEPGMWSVTEIATLPDYILDETEHHVELFPNRTSELRLKNDKKPLLTLSKIDADTQEPIPNTVLTVKALDGTYQDDWKTGPDGTVSLRVDPGVYEVTEKSVPSPYYVPDKDADRIQTITLSPGDEKTLVFRNRKAPELTIFKENSITGEAIEHAKFHITYTSNGEAAEAPATIDYGEAFTDSRGEIKVHELGKRLYPGEFTITEVEPADGFQLKEPITQKVIIHGNESKTVRFQNTPLSALVVWKYDSVTKEPVEGAIFQVKYMSGTSGTGGTVIGTYRTGPGGSFTINRLKAGAYLVEELASDDNHVMDTAPQTAYISGKEQDVVQLYFGNSPKGAILIKKIDSMTHKPLSDCEFFITDSHGTMLGDANGKFVTDSAGTILISNIAPGTTIVARETRAKENYILDDVPQTATIKAGQTVTLEFRNQPKGSVTLYKFSSVDRRTPLEGVGFKITFANGQVVDNIGGKLSSNGIYYTDSEGQINISGVTGTLIFTEISSIPGYLIDENRKSQTIVVNPGDHQSVYFYNIPENTLIIEKYIEEEGSEHKPLKGVTFLVTDSSGAVIGPNNGEYISDENGRIVIPNLEPGITVTAKEIRVPDGVVLDSTPKSIEIKGGEGGQTLRFVNQRAGNLIINKVDGIDKHPLSGVTFKITYADGSNVDQDGGKTSSNGIYTTDANGQIKISGIVGTVKITEIETVPGYYIEEKYRTQTVEIRPNDTQTITIYNTPTQALVVQKFVTGSKDKPLAGVEFLVTDSDGTVLGPNNGIYKTDQFGRITIKDLTPGTVITARETKTLDGFVLDSTPQSVEIKSGEVQTLTFYNAPIGGLELIKVSEADKSQRIKGVTFEIRKMDGALVDTVTTGDRGRVHASLDAGDYYCVEVEAAEGFKLDSTPHYFTIKDNETTTLTVTNAPFSGIILHKIDSVTGLGIYNVKFLVYDQNKNPIGEYTTDDGGYIYIDDLTVQGKGKLFIRELEAAPGYELDKQYKTVYVQPGKTVEIEWENTPITGQFQIYKYAAEYNEVTGTPARAPLQGAVYEISEARSGRVVDYITTDARGVAASKPLPLGRYKIVEVTAPAYWQLSGKTYDETLEYSGVRFVP